MNVILVVFDSLRKDSINVLGAPPWGPVQTPHFDAFAAESLVATRMYPESLPTLPTRRALYTGKRVYPFHNADFRLKGDFVGAPGWGPIPEEQDTLAELLYEAGYRTGLIADVYHMFKPSKNYTRGFEQWSFLRGQECDPARSGPRLTEEEMAAWLPPGEKPKNMWFMQNCLTNLRDRRNEEEYFSPKVLREAAIWLEQNRDAENFFLTVESFDPHEPWLVPEHYRKMYQKEDGPEQIDSAYGMHTLPDYLLKRTQANYSGSVTQCDRWFGHLMEAVRVLGLLDNTMVILTTDHGHSMGDRGYLGKRGYPSAPEVFDVPLMVRFPGGEHAGTTTDMFLNHTDISAEILNQAGVKPKYELDGKAFLADAVAGKSGHRDHVTVGWGSTPTVITDRWWFNCKVDGTGMLLHDLTAADPYAENLADKHPDIVADLFTTATADAEGGFPEWLMTLAKDQADAPGCSDMAARE